MAKTTLKLSSTLEDINKTMASANTAGVWYKVKYTDTNKALVLSKKALEVLQGAGVNLEMVYISYNKYPQVFNTIENILVENSDIFTAREA